MSQAMKAKEFLGALISGRRDFREIIIDEEVIIENTLFKGSYPRINCKDAQIKSLTVNDETERLSLCGSKIEYLAVNGKIGRLELQNATINTLDLSDSEITWLFLSGITITDDFFFSHLETREISCGDNLELACLLVLQGQKVTANYKTVKDLFSSFQTLIKIINA